MTWFQVCHHLLPIDLTFIEPNRINWGVYMKHFQADYAINTTVNQYIGEYK